MKKIAVLLLSSIFVLLLVSSAFAAGWHTIDGVTTAQHDPDAGKWAASSGGDTAKVPHLGLQASTNACKACHAVHEGNSGSFKLLNDSTRGTECDYCHAASGALTDTNKKPYGIVSAPYGEHSLGTNTMANPDFGSTAPNPKYDPSWKYLIPNAGNDVIAANSIRNEGLACGNCHTVHNAYSLWGNGSTDLLKSGTLATKLLKRDPAENDGDVLAGVMSVAAYDGKPPALGDTGNIDSNEVLATFCADCHNKNMNWDRGPGTVSTKHPAPDGAPSEGERANGSAHVLGAGTDGVIDVYGQDKTIANTGLVSCNTCHGSKGQTTSRWPHQSRGHKLFGNGYRTASTVPGFSYTGDPGRTLPNLDEGVCKTCHPSVGRNYDPTSY